MGTAPLSRQTIPATIGNSWGASRSRSSPTVIDGSRRSEAAALMAESGMPRWRKRFPSPLRRARRSLDSDLVGSTSKASPCRAVVGAREDDAVVIRFRATSPRTQRSWLLNER